MLAEPGIWMRLHLVTGMLHAGRGHHDEAPPRTGQLSPGELKVLRYLPTNLSRPEIAAELSVSVNTVGTHVRSSYAKLGADDRSAAVRRVRDLRLLSAARALALHSAV